MIEIILGAVCGLIVGGAIGSFSADMYLWSREDRAHKRHEEEGV